MIDITNKIGINTSNSMFKVTSASSSKVLNLLTNNPKHFKFPINENSNNINISNPSISSSNISNQFNNSNKVPNLRPNKSFGDFLKSSFENLENLDAKSNELSNKAVFDPDSVEIHDVMLASEKARFALNFTKTLSDGLIRTFKELSSPR